MFYSSQSFDIDPVLVWRKMLHVNRYVTLLLFLQQYVLCSSCGS